MIDVVMPLAEVCGHTGQGCAHHVGPNYAGDFNTGGRG